MYNIGKDPREVNQNPVEKAKQVAAVVAAVGNPPKPVEKVGKFHYPQTFVGNVVKVEIRRGNLVKLWKQSVGTVPQKDIMRKCAQKQNQHTLMFLILPIIPNQIISMNMETLFMLMHTWSMLRKLIAKNT